MQSQYDPYLAKINEDVCPHEMVYMMTTTDLSLTKDCMPWAKVKSYTMTGGSKGWIDYKVTQRNFRGEASILCHGCGDGSADCGDCICPN